MTEFYVDEKDNGKMLTEAISRRFGKNASGKLFRALRKRDVKIDGNRTGDNVKLSAGTHVVIYEDFIKEKVNYDILFENDKFIAVNKPQGVPVSEDKNGEKSLIDALKEDISPKLRLCHRLDRNTGGIVLAAKSDACFEKIKKLFDAEDRQIIKKYTCLVRGIVDAKIEIMLENYLFKDSKKSIVYIYDEPRKGAMPCSLKYRAISTDDVNNISKLEIELITGRTHQIRAQLAHIAHPIVGDGKYGREEINKKAGYRFQALWASETAIPLKSGLFYGEDIKAAQTGSERLKMTLYGGEEYIQIISKPDFR
ncbi:MAG: RluA family pseudouridine synthase [Clostridia bacterium]|nr:RluA family pseudouridine synthase [Clostridia bacterium]